MTTTAAPPGVQAQVVVPVRHPGRWVGGVVVLLLVALLLVKLGTIDKIHYPSITKYLFQRSIVQGVVTTVELAVVSQLIGVVLGTLLATIRLLHKPVLSAVSWAYIFFFRGTPLIVQILFWYNGLLELLPRARRLDRRLTTWRRVGCVAGG